MAIFWKDSFSTGVEEVDNQHKKLFEEVNKFEKMMKANPSVADVEKTLIFLTEYTINHFSFEEGCMESYNCPVAARNKEAHKRFLMALEHLKKRFDEEGADELLLEHIHRTTETWLVNHIGDIDTHLKECVSGA